MQPSKLILKYEYILFGYSLLKLVEFCPNARILEHNQSRSNFVGVPTKIQFVCQLKPCYFPVKYQNERPRYH